MRPLPIPVEPAYRSCLSYFKSTIFFVAERSSAFRL
jgi:hypothetical protein